MRRVFIAGYAFLAVVMAIFGLSALVAQDAPDAAITTLVALKRVSTEVRMPHAVRLEATVWYADAAGGKLIVSDASGVADVQMDFNGIAFQPGDCVRVSGSATVMNRECGVELAPLALIDNDGIHTEFEKSGTVRLEAGRHLIRLDCFNASNLSDLNIEYSGPGFSRRLVPDYVLHRKLPEVAGADAQTAGKPGWADGVDFRLYRKRQWMLPPNRNAGVTEETGVAENFDDGFVAGHEYTGVIFDGYIDVGEAGEYAFFLRSDDGSRLIVGPASLRVEKIAGAGLASSALPEPKQLFPGQALRSREDYLWGCLEGRVSRASHAGSESYLWLESGAGHVRVEIADASALPWNSIRNKVVRMTGVVRCGMTLDGVPLQNAVFVQDAAHVEIEEGVVARQNAREFSPDILAGAAADANAAQAGDFTSVTQIERFDRSVPDGRHSVRIHGVVTRVVSSVAGVVLQDEARGIYVNLESIAAGPMQIGEMIEVTGRVEPGEFSPFIVAEKLVRRGAGIMPAPVRTSREEMINGSLHSQYVEIEGYVLAVGLRTITLRTRMGVLWVDTETETSVDWLDCVVRIRGCMRVFWDLKTRQINTGKVGIDYAEVSIERAAPVDLFAVAKKHVSELLMFDPDAVAFQRTRVVGQIVRKEGAELCIMDEGEGARVSLVPDAPLSSGDSPLAIGDVVEVAGFPEFDGPSPHFDHAIARRVGHAPLPEPRALAPEKLLHDDYDATRVSAEAQLIGMSQQDGWWTLQMRAGANTFRAVFDDAQMTRPDYAPGSVLRVTGIYHGLGGNRNLNQPVGAFEIFAASVADVQVLATPSWWTLSRLLAVVGVLCVVLLLAFLWIKGLRRQVAVKTAQLEVALEERHRVQQDEAVASERSRLAYDLHDELGAGLSEIGMLSTLVASPSLVQEKRDSYTHRLADKARRMVAALDEIVWAVNPRYDAIASFANYYTTYAQQFLEAASLRCRLRVADDLPQQPLTSRVRHTLFLGFSEALTNVAKHARATEVEICIFIEERRNVGVGGANAGAHAAAGARVVRWLVVSVADDGCGMKRDVAAENARLAGRNGLASIAARMRQLKGECVIEPSEPHGTKVILRVPLA